MAAGLQGQPQVPPPTSSRFSILSWQTRASPGSGNTPRPPSPLHSLPGWQICPRSLLYHRESGQCRAWNQGLRSPELSLSQGPEKCLGQAGVAGPAHRLPWQCRLVGRRALLRGLGSVSSIHLPHDPRCPCPILGLGILLCGMGGPVSVQGPQGGGVPRKSLPLMPGGSCLFSHGGDVAGVLQVRSPPPPLSCLLFRTPGRQMLSHGSLWLRILSWAWEIR